MMIVMRNTWKAELQEPSVEDESWLLPIVRVSVIDVRTPLGNKRHRVQWLCVCGLDLDRCQSKRSDNPARTDVSELLPVRK